MLRVLIRTIELCRRQRGHNSVAREDRVLRPKSLHVFTEERRAHGAFNGALLYVRQAVWPKRRPPFILKPYGVKPVVVGAVEIRLHLCHPVRIRARGRPVVNPRSFQVPNIPVSCAHKNIVRHVGKDETVEVHGGDRMQGLYMKPKP